MLEKYAFPYVVMAGAALVALGVLWFLIAAINWRKAVRPLLLMLLGVVVAAVPFGVNYYYQRHLNLGPREKVVDGELHITLTGWDRSDYSVLQDRSQTVVLNLQRARALSRIQPDPARPRAAVPDHVGHRFANRPCQRSLKRRIDVRASLLDHGLDARAAQGNLGSYQFGFESRRHRAGDGLAHVADRLAGQSLHVRELGRSTCVTPRTEAAR